MGTATITNRPEVLFGTCGYSILGGYEESGDDRMRAKRGKCRACRELPAALEMHPT